MSVLTTSGAERASATETVVELWKNAAQGIDWDVPPSAVFDDTNGPRRVWFPDARLNTCYNAVDRHVLAGRGGQTALVYVSAMTGVCKQYTFAELQYEIGVVAGMIAALGAVAGDRVVIYMPMIPEAVFAMLACARLGVVHSVVFGGFAALELAKRIRDADPRMILIASCGLEPGRRIAYKPLLDEARVLSERETVPCVVLQRPELPGSLQSGLDFDWNELRARASAAACVSVAASHPLYILYTSGTTGVPKGVVRDNGGHAVALNHSMRHVYGIEPGEVFWAASDVGWVVGHSYIVYGPLLRGCTTVLFEGKPVGTPDAATYWRVVQSHGVNVFFSAPTALRAIRREDPDAHGPRAIPSPRLRAIFLAGERADAATVEWAERAFHVPVIDHWWQTELGWPAIATCLSGEAIATRSGSAGRAVSGFNCAVLGPDGETMPAGKVGDLALKLPLPPGCLHTLWNNDAGLVNSYLTQHPGYFTSGDVGYIDVDGFIFVLGRTDDILNIAGHRLSAGTIEQALARHPEVAECAVVAAPDALKGEIPIGLAVLKAACRRSPEQVTRELVDLVRHDVGPVAAFKTALIVERLPKTRSGKILRNTLRCMVRGEPYRIPATIEDATVLPRIEADLSRIGYPRTKELI